MADQRYGGRWLGDEAQEASWMYRRDGLPSDMPDWLRGQYTWVEEDNGTGRWQRSGLQDATGDRVVRTGEGGRSYWSGEQVKDPSLVRYNEDLGWITGVDNWDTSQADAARRRRRGVATALFGGALGAGLMGLGTGAPGIFGGGDAALAGAMDETAFSGMMGGPPTAIGGTLPSVTAPTLGTMNGLSPAELLALTEGSGAPGAVGNGSFFSNLMSGDLGGAGSALLDSIRANPMSAARFGMGLYGLAGDGRPSGGGGGPGGSMGAPSGPITPFQMSPFQFTPNQANQAQIQAAMMDPRFGMFGG